MSDETTGLLWENAFRLGVEKYAPAARTAWLGARADLSTKPIVALVPVGAPAGARMYYVKYNTYVNESVEIPEELAGDEQACMRYLETIWRMSGE